MAKEKQDKHTEDGASIDDAPANQRDSIRSFIATLASFSGDLSALTCPSFLLSTMSVLEYRQVAIIVTTFLMLTIQVCCMTTATTPEEKKIFGEHDIKKNCKSLWQSIRDNTILSYSHRQLIYHASCQ